jgi:hypothetical protein
MDLTAPAFSVHNFISSVGADAGFAAIIGLAVLILLYFAHARETANLREEASILAERLQQAEARVAELRQAQPVSAAVPAAEGVQVTDRRGAGVPALPFAPAGVGAPALAAATRVVPVVEPPPPPSVPPPAPVPALALAGASATAPAAAPSSSSAVASGPPPTSPGPAVPRPATTAGANGGGRGAGAPVASERPPARPAPVGLPPLGEPARGRGGAGRRIAVGLAALVLVAAAVVALIVVTRSSSSSSNSAGQAATTNAPSPRPATGFSPASVTVAVLNGTATNRLAHRVAAKLAASGYHKGDVATAATQTQTNTVVAYLPGAKNRADALHVASALSLKPTAVQRIDQATQQVACPAPGPCTANVVVTVGSDLATLS